MTGRRFFLDANVLLNAVFLPASMSQQAVNLLSHNASKIFTCTTTVDEAKRVATKISQRHCQWFEAKEAIDKFLIRNAVEILAGVPIKTGRAHDNHVVSGATTAAATLVTLDSELHLSCISSGVNTKSSLDVIREFAGWKLQTTCFGVLPRPSSGYVFLRAIPGEWGGRARKGRFTVADFPGAMTISYNAQFSAWQFDFDSRKLPTRVSCCASAGEMQTICVSWGPPHELRIRIAGVPNPVDEILSLQMAPITEYRLGSDRHSSNYWNGWLYCCITDDRPLGANTWSSVLRHQELTPNPFDTDRLEDVFRAMGKAMYLPPK